MLLELCPFCGGTAEHRESHGWHGVGCNTDKCPAYLHALMFRTAAEAYQVWNCRPAGGTSQGSSARPMALDEARRIVRQRDRRDPGRAVLAAAAVLRWEANYDGDDAALGPIADHLEATADAMAAAGVGGTHDA